MRKHSLKLASFSASRWRRLSLRRNAPQPMRRSAEPRRTTELRSGQRFVQPRRHDDWVSAIVNRPITSGDKLWTDNGARAELHSAPRRSVFPATLVFHS